MSQCRAVLWFKGVKYQCDMDAPHPGLAHSIEDPEAAWCSDGEARRYKEKR